MKKKFDKFIFWTPRILSILFIVFLALMSLDVFEMHAGFWGTILALLMHNIPVFILTAALIVAWKYEIVGSIAFFFGGLLYAVLVLITVFRDSFHWYYVAWIVQISGIAFIVGGLFLAGWLRKRNKKK